MFTTAPTVVDRDRYRKASSHAIDDVANVWESALATLGPDPTNVDQDPDLVYENYANTVTDMPRVMFGAHRTRRLVRQICGELGFTVTFTAFTPEYLGLFKGFVSWLIVNFKEKELVIAYDPENVAKVASSTFGQDKLLAKLFLHECGHASLHLQDLKNRITEDDPTPELGSRHEQEAWLYAVVVRGILIGDRALATRKYKTGDEGWEIA